MGLTTELIYDVEYFDDALVISVLIYSLRCWEVQEREGALEANPSILFDWRIEIESFHTKRVLHHEEDAITMQHNHLERFA